MAYFKSTISTNKKLVIPSFKLKFNQDCVKQALILNESVNEASSEKCICKICSSTILKSNSRSHVGNNFKYLKIALIYSSKYEYFNS
jgi:hypothetical protein